MDLSVIIVNWNTRRLLLKCLQAVFSTIDCPSYEVLVVDNGSVDGSCEAVQEKFPQVTLIKNEENLGFAKANNIALKQSKGRYAMLLNSDAFLTPGAAGELVSFLDKTPNAALACGQLLQADGSLQNSFAVFPCVLSVVFNESFLRIILPKSYQRRQDVLQRPLKVDSCIGACMVVRKGALDHVGLLDESFFFFFEETDWALRMRNAGWEIYFIPSARIYHCQGASAGTGISSRIMYYESRYIYLRKWHGRLYYLMRLLIAFRLLIDACGSGLAVAFTLGLNPPIRDRFLRYVGLITWHLRGCRPLR